MYGKPRPMCHEVTMLCRVDHHTREATFKVWERNGESGQDTPRRTLYEGPNFGMAYDAMTTEAEHIEHGLIPQ